MNERLSAVMQRRNELLAEIASQREQVEQIGARWQAPLALADHGLAGLRYLRSRPVLVVGLAALMVWRRRGVLGLLRTAWMMRKGYRNLTAFTAGISSFLS